MALGSKIRTMTCTKEVFFLKGQGFDLACQWVPHTLTGACRSVCDLLFFETSTLLRTLDANVGQSAVGNLLPRLLFLALASYWCLRARNSNALPWYELEDRDVFWPAVWP